MTTTKDEDLVKFRAVAYALGAVLFSILGWTVHQVGNDIDRVRDMTAIQGLAITQTNVALASMVSSTALRSQTVDSRLDNMVATQDRQYRLLVQIAEKSGIKPQ